MTTTPDAAFADLVARFPGSAAAHIPLTMHRDDIAKMGAGARWRHLDFCSLYIVRRGRGLHIVDGRPYGIARGDVYVMTPGMTHAFRDDDSLMLDTVHFVPSLFDIPTLDALGDEPGFLPLFLADPHTQACRPEHGSRWLHLTPQPHEETIASLEEMHREWASGGLVNALVVRALFLRLLVRLARRFAADGLAARAEPGVTSDIRETAVAAAVRIMDERHCEPLRIDEVAAAVFFSPDRFTEIFCATMGRTPRDYLRHLRLQTAQTLLRTTSLSISDVALRSGFSEPAYFARAFRTQVGESPGEYRRREKALRLSGPTTPNLQ